MSNVKGRRSLFELMSSAPETQAVRPKRRMGLLMPWRDAKRNDAAMIVAEALTEEEAAAELAAQRAAAEDVDREKREKLEARQAAKEAKRAARQRVKEVETEDTSDAIPDAVDAADEAPSKPRFKIPSFSFKIPKLPFSWSAFDFKMPLRIEDGRVRVSLNATSGIVVSAILVVFVIGAYSLGTRSSKKPLATLRSTEDPALAEQLAKSTGESSGSNGGKNSANRSGRSDKLDLSGIRRPAVVAEASARANQPVSLKDHDHVASGVDETKLNFLQIETFRVTRDKSSEVLRQEMQDVRKFLADKGVLTQARLYPRGYVLYSTQGYLPSGDYKSQRETLQKRVEQLGQEYFRAGGLYQFKGCYFVSYSKAMSGQPAS